MIVQAIAPLVLQENLCLHFSAFVSTIEELFTFQDQCFQIRRKRQPGIFLGLLHRAQWVAMQIWMAVGFLWVKSGLSVGKEDFLTDAKFFPHAENPAEGYWAWHETAPYDLSVVPTKRPLVYAFGTDAYFVEEFRRFCALPDHKTEKIHAHIDVMMQMVNEVAVASPDFFERYKVERFKDWNRFCEQFNAFVRFSGRMTPEVHYFRNKLNVAPLTLGEMMHVAEGWILESVSDSSYHMFGETGAFNLKFISVDEKFEAVYPISGVALTHLRRMTEHSLARLTLDDVPGWREAQLLTEHNDPINMATYNYSRRSHDKLLHGFLDAGPYSNETFFKVITGYGWLNVPPRGAKWEPGDPGYVDCTLRRTNKAKFYNDPTAVAYRRAAKQLFYANGGR